MVRTNATNRLRRLELLAVHLKQYAHCTVKDLAHQHGVSERTITRDLSLMRDQGMQIDADRGRGGGVHSTLSELRARRRTLRRSPRHSRHP